MTGTVATLRERPEPRDEARVRDLVRGTGFFSAEEVDIAAELVREGLGPETPDGYRFVFLERGPELLAYTCFGRIPGTEASFDLYWIATLDAERGQGHGRRVLEATEARIRALDGRRVYVETSSRAQYEPTRRFYLARGYAEWAFLEDFYRPGDGKRIYGKVL